MLKNIYDNAEINESLKTLQNCGKTCIEAVYLLDFLIRTRKDIIHGKEPSYANHSLNGYIMERKKPWEFLVRIKAAEISYKRDGRMWFDEWHLKMIGDSLEVIKY